VSEDEVSFPDLMGELDYSMLIVTTAAGGERAGCLVGFATQVSIDPPRFLVCLSVQNRTFRVACAAPTLAVHFVPREQGELAELFGGETGDETDKFARVQWRPGPDGVPVLSALENWFAGRVLERYDFGDHHGFLLEPVEGAAGRGDASLTFHRARRIEPGHPA
jgi:flavin reductase (DIM6/NTAB) family NADH-FMN oxidoreductase RutF